MLTPFSFVNKRVSLANEDFGHLKILQQQKKYQENKCCCAKFSNTCRLLTDKR